MHDAYPRLFEPVFADRERPDPRHLEQGGVPRARPRGGGATARAQRRAGVRVAFPDARRVRARARARHRPRRVRGRRRRRAPLGAVATAPRPSSRRPAELAARRAAATTARSRPPGQADAAGRRAGVRPHGARRARRRRRARSSPARYRSDAEQAVLFAAPPGPEVGRAAGHVAAPARHRARPRPAAAPTAGWRANAGRFHFSSATAGSRGTSATRSTPSSRRRPRTADGGERAARCRSFVPAALRARARARGAALERLGATLLAAQLYAGVQLQPVRGQPRAARRASRSSCRARPRALGLRDPFDAERAIDAQAHLMRDLLRRFGSRPARARRLQRRPGAGRRLRLRARRSARRAATSRASSA